MVKLIYVVIIKYNENSTLLVNKINSLLNNNWNKTNR